MHARLPRRSLGILVLVAASAALLATSPPPPTAEAEAQGEVDVGPGNPARVEARFSVDNPGDNEIVRVDVHPVLETWNDPRVSSMAQAAIDDGPPSVGGQTLELPPAACRNGCDVSVAIDARWIGDAGPGTGSRFKVPGSEETRPAPGCHPERQ